jgi:long-chain fatty acid transport protein
MHFASRVTQISALALGIAGALAFGQAQASGFQLKENSVKATGRAYAGSGAAAGDASVVINNPAAMTLFDESVVQADIHAIDLSYEIDAGGTDAFGRPLTGGDGGNAGSVAAVPALSAIFPLGDSGVTFGAAISAPFGLKTEYEDGWVGRYHALESDVRIVDLNLAFSVDISERFSLGAGLIVERAEVTLSNAIDFGSAVCTPSAATGGLPPPFCLPLGSNVYGPQQNDGKAVIEGEDTGFGWTFGMHLRPTDNLSFGLSHRSEIDLELEGEADFTVPANVVPILAVGRPGQFVDTDVTAPLTTPSITTFSAAWQVTDAFALMADVSATDWHSLEAIDINYASPQPNTVEDFDWEDTMFYSIGAEFALNEAFTLRAGLAYDETPVQDETRTPRLPDNDRNWFSIGATWAPSETLEISGAYTRIMVDDPELDIVSTSGSRLVGEAEGHANIFGVSAQYKF